MFKLAVTEVDSAAKAVEASIGLHLIRRSEKFRLVPQVDLASRLAKADSVHRPVSVAWALEVDLANRPVSVVWALEVDMASKPVSVA